MSGRSSGARGIQHAPLMAGVPAYQEALPRSRPGAAAQPSATGGIFKSAAVEVLRRERRLMSTGEICRLALEWGLLNCHGKTPEATMASSLYGDIKRRDGESLFIRPQEGMFGLREWVDEGYLPPMTDHSTPMPNKRSHKAARQPPARRKRGRRRAADEDSDYFTEEEEEELLSEELDASDSDSQRAQRAQQQQQPPKKRRGWPKGRPRKPRPPEATAPTAAPTAMGPLAGAAGAAGTSGGGSGASALAMLGELASSPPIRRLLSYEPQAFAEAFAASLQAQQRVAAAFGPYASAQPVADALAALDLGPLLQQGGTGEGQLSPPLYAALQSPLLPAACLPLHHHHLGHAAAIAGTGAVPGSIFSPAVALSLRDLRTPGPGPLGALAGGSCGPAGPALPLPEDCSPDMLSIHLPPGIPAMPLHLPVPPVAPTAPPSLANSLPGSAVKPGRRGGGKGGGGAASSSLGAGGLVRADSGCSPAGKGAAAPGPRLMVPLGSAGPAAPHGYCAPMSTTAAASFKPAAGCAAGTASCGSAPVFEIHTFPGMPGLGLGAAVQLSLDGGAVQPAATSADPSCAASLDSVAEVSMKIAELEEKVARVEAHFGGRDPRTGQAHMWLHEACQRVPPHMELLFRAKGEAALARAYKIMQASNAGAAAKRGLRASSALSLHGGSAAGAAAAAAAPEGLLPLQAGLGPAAATATAAGAVHVPGEGAHGLGGAAFKESPLPLALLPLMLPHEEPLGEDTPDDDLL